LHSAHIIVVMDRKGKKNKAISCWENSSEIISWRNRHWL